ncbi:MAG: hypothetical protein WC244_03570 [Patescibacteria group bacterium]|jgi:hypothetical protein
MKLTQKKFIAGLLTLAIAVTMIGLPFVAGASTDLNTADENLNSFQTASGLGDADLSTMIGTLVKAILSLLGVVAILIVLYGGFKWMTAAGDEGKVDGAKKLIISGIIGIIIVVAAYAIASFVLSAIQNAAGTGATY